MRKKLLVKINKGVDVVKISLNNISIKLMQNPFIISIVSTIFLLILMQFIIPFDPMLLVLNLVLVYWAIRCKYVVIE
jgi:hypothetical protein